ncbi:Glutamate receptor ionotropic, kainate 4-like 6 [Homarus americanus]|uniref:Glutamate receptor ionotropic, kainate 4-like 6 n=1 Tax=Homarus americanus TaxID=6706 RepID=A0A8J5JQV4_HOMAM|nr:Glutamate receptor ionotropic, kainate 4-like 6 [Homarus americanus]
MLKILSSRIVFLVVLVKFGLAKLPHLHVSAQDTLTSAREAVKAVLAPETYSTCSVFLFHDGTISSSSAFMMLRQLRASGGVGMFQVPVHNQELNVSLVQLNRAVADARQLLQVSWCVTVVVVSDDPVFLTAFAEWSLKGRLLVWSTRLLVVTLLPLPELQHLHKTFSMTNSMLLVVDDTISRRFIRRPTLKLVMVGGILNRQVTKDDPEAPGRKRLWFTGLDVTMLEHIATALNMSYTFVTPPDRSLGTLREDGTWSGMEVDLSPQLFGVSVSRAEVVSFTYPIQTFSLRILASRGKAQVDTWGFLLPFDPLVWMAILVSFLATPAAAFIATSWLSAKTTRQNNNTTHIFVFFRVLFQQDISVATVWWWHRIVLAVWILMTLVLTRSYAGNLMALLAVRHIPQPYQSLRDVLDDPSVNMMWEANTKFIKYFRGMFVILVGGEALGLFVLACEIVLARIRPFFNSVE